MGTCLHHLLDIVSDVFEEACSHIRRAVHNQAHGKMSPAGQPSHEGTSVRCVCWNSKRCHELEGTLHASFHSRHVSKEGIAPQRAAKECGRCHCSNVHFACRTKAVALSWWCSIRDSTALPWQQNETGRARRLSKRPPQQVLRCAALRCAALCCAALCCAVLRCAALCCAVLC